jgi:DNA-binding IclR family transcriptional regulator
VDRAAALLDLIVSSPVPRTFTSLVHELGLARSTTSRLLQALERGLLVQRDRHGLFRPGALFALYAARQNALDDLTDLSTLTQPMLDRLAEITGETANLAVPRGGAVVQVAQADGAYLLGATNWIGVDVPAHCSAQGKVFLAYDRLRPEDRLERRTPATITSPAVLDRELAEVRRRGWASAWEELEVGLVAVAAPVRGRDGLVIAALSVSGPTARVPGDRVATIATVVVEQATAASTQLGHSRKAGAA